MWWLGPGAFLCGFSQLSCLHGYFDFFLQSKDIHVRLTGGSELAVFECKYE